MPPSRPASLTHSRNCAATSARTPATRQTRSRPALITGAPLEQRPREVRLRAGTAHREGDHRRVALLVGLGEGAQELRISSRKAARGKRASGLRRTRRPRQVLPQRRRARARRGARAAAGSRCTRCAPPGTPYACSRRTTRSRGREVAHLGSSGRRRAPRSRLTSESVTTQCTPSQPCRSGLLPPGAKNVASRGAGVARRRFHQAAPQPLLDQPVERAHLEVGRREVALRVEMGDVGQRVQQRFERRPDDRDLRRPRGDLVSPPGGAPEAQLLGRGERRPVDVEDRRRRGTRPGRGRRADGRSPSPPR